MKDRLHARAAGSAPQSAVPDSLSFHDLLALVRSERRALVLTFGATLAVAVLYLSCAVPSYRATGLLQVSRTEEVGVKSLLNLASLSQPTPVATDIEILRSRHIMLAAIQTHNLALDQSSWPVTLDLSVSLLGDSPLSSELLRLRAAVHDVQIDETYRKEIPATLTVSDDHGLDLLLDGDKAATHVAPGGTLSHKGVCFGLLATPPLDLAPGTRVKVELVPNHVLVDDMLEDLTVRNLGQRQNDTSVVEVSFVHHDRTVARDVVNSIMSAYYEFSLEWQTQEADRAAQFIEQQLTKTREQLDETAQELQHFLEQSGGMLLDEQGRELVQGASKLQMDRRVLVVEDQMLTAASAEIRRHAHEGGTLALADATYPTDPELAGALSEYARIARERDAADQGLLHARASVLLQIDRAQRRVGQRKALFDNTLGDLQRQFATFPEKQRQLTAIQRKLTVSEHLFALLMTKLEEARILRASKTTDKRIIDHAVIPYTKVSPKRGLLLLGAILLGLLLGVGLVLGRHVVDPRIRDQDEAAALTGLTLHGTIGEFAGPLAKADLRSVLQQVLGDPRGAVAEAYRSLRISLEFAAADGAELKTVLVTSSQASEGKSTVVANLAAALAKAGHKVLVVDADLRRAKQHEIWNLPRAPGLSDLLQGRAQVAPLPTSVEGVSVLPAGQEPPEPQVLLGSKAFADLLEGWRRDWGIVLFDAPPLILADALLVARACDLALFVVRPRVSQRSLVKNAIRLLTQSARRCALVVNGQPLNGSSYSYYQYHREAGSPRAKAAPPS
jgi:capsular exopolysaccharide synthesis family protein